MFDQIPNLPNYKDYEEDVDPSDDEDAVENYNEATTRQSLTVHSSKFTASKLYTSPFLIEQLGIVVL